MVASPPLLSASASSSSSAVASTDCKACPRAALSTALEEHEDAPPASRALAVVRWPMAISRRVHPYVERTLTRAPCRAVQVLSNTNIEEPSC